MAVGAPIVIATATPATTRATVIRPLPRASIVPRSAFANVTCRRHGAQSPGDPAGEAGDGPAGGASPTQSDSRPHDRSMTLPSPDMSTTPLALIVAVTESALTSIDTRTRPADVRASTVHGSPGSLAKSIGGMAAPGFAVPTGCPFTTSVTAS